MRRPLVALTALLVVAAGAPLGAQATVPLTRGETMQRALTRSAQLPLAGADTLVAAATLLAARALPNPVLTASYTRDLPRYHLQAEVPLALPWIRNARVGSARIGSTAARLRYQVALGAAVLDADTEYTRAVASLERSRLSARTAADADTLLRLAIARRDAGDASDLDVELGRVNAGQQANTAASDSLEVRSTLLELQLAIGISGDSVTVLPTDSLTVPDTAARATPGEPVAVAAAAAQLESARLELVAERRSVWNALSLIAGIDAGAGSEQSGLLPVLGVALPFPIFDRNRGAVATANAERQRAVAELALARLESRTQVAATRRELESALGRLGRGRAVVESADRVAALSLTAYREGASTLPAVLEAQRSARETRAQYIDDLARAWIALATLRTLTQTAMPVTP